MSVTLLTPRDAPALAEKINYQHQQAQSFWRTTAQHAIRCGELLQEAKLDLDHGDWTGWLAENFTGSPRTARQYMQLADAHRENPALLQAADDSSISVAVRAVAKPRRQPQTQDQIVDATVVQDQYTLTVTQLAQLVKAFGGATTEDRIRTWIERLTEPKMGLCADCDAPIIQVNVKGTLVTADADEWEPRAACQSCLHTRRAHPGQPISCSRCFNTGYVGVVRPPGPMLAIDMAWAETPHARVIGERTDRRKGEAAHPIHQCPRRRDQKQAA